MEIPCHLWPLFLLILFSDHSSGSPYFPWQQPSHNNSTPLLCPDRCLTEFLLERDQLSCCCCRARPVWDIPPTWPYRQVDIEYTSRRGRGLAVYSADDVSRNISKLVHTDGSLSWIPDNICLFADLVLVDLSRNRIRELTNVNCLQRLDTLILKNNLITYLSNVTLLGMRELRTLDLSNNVLTTIEPSAISDPSLGMLHVIFKENSLETVDITNVITEKPFCIVDYSDNNLKEIVNEIGWVVDKAKDYGEGGYVDFSDNINLAFPDFESLGFEDLLDLGKVFSFGFDFRNVNFFCDCKMQPFLEMAKEALEKIWRDYFEVRCAGPPDLQGVLITDLIKHDLLDNLTCDFGVGDRCPLGCLCFHQPSKDRVVVDCSNTSKTSLPEALPPVPAGNLLEMKFNTNQIKEFNNRTFLINTRSLNMDNNDLLEVSNESLWNSIAIEMLLFRNNTNLRNLPESLKLLNPCNVSFGDLYLQCACDILWIRDWTNSPKAMTCPGNNNFSCLTEDGDMLPSFTWTKQNLKCPRDISWVPIAIAVIFAVSSLVLGVVAWMLYHYRYEVYLLTRRENKDGIISGSKYFKYDVYVSFNESNRQLLSWVCNQLEPELNSLGYSLCLPCRDIPLGAPKSDAILEYLQKSKKFLFVLDENFFQSEDATLWCCQEWRNSWHIFKSEKLRNIAVVNYDQLRTKDVDHRQMQAFLRLGLAVDFSNRKGMIFDEILERLKLNRIPSESDHHVTKGDTDLDLSSYFGPYFSDVHRYCAPKPTFLRETLDSNKRDTFMPYSVGLRRFDTPKHTFKVHPLFSGKVHPDE